MVVEPVGERLPPMSEAVLRWKFVRNHFTILEAVEVVGTSAPTRSQRSSLLDGCATRREHVMRGAARFGASSERVREFELAPKGAARGSPVVGALRPACREFVLNPSPASCAHSGPTSRSMVMSLTALHQGLTRQPEDAAGSRADRRGAGEVVSPFACKGDSSNSTPGSPTYPLCRGACRGPEPGVIPIGIFDVRDPGTLYQ